MPLERDKFWDRGSRVSESALDPTQYHDPSEETLPASHTSLAAALPPGTMGARGTIIRRSTLDGAPLGWDPNGVAMRVNVDPEIPGQGFVIDPTQISQAGALMATQQAGVRGAQTIEDLRFRAASAMQAFAISSQPDIVPNSTTRPREAPIAMPGVYVVPESTPGGAQIRPAAPEPVNTRQGVQTKHAEIPQNPMHNLPGFSANPVVPQPAPPQVSPVAPPQMNPVAAKPASLFASLNKQPPAPPAPTLGEVRGNQMVVGAPTYKVTMEVKDSPVSNEAWFHDVIRNEQVLALCYDTRVVGYPRTRLRPQPEDIAIRVEGAAMFFICTDPGISFKHGSDEITIYLIKAAYPFKEETEVPQMPGLM